MSSAVPSSPPIERRGISPAAVDCKHAHCLKSMSAFVREHMYIPTTRFGAPLKIGRPPRSSKGAEMMTTAEEDDMQERIGELNKGTWVRKNGKVER